MGRQDARREGGHESVAAAGAHHAAFRVLERLDRLRWHGGRPASGCCPHRGASRTLNVPAADAPRVLGERRRSADADRLAGEPGHVQCGSGSRRGWIRLFRVRRGGCAAAPGGGGDRAAFLEAVATGSKRRIGAGRLERSHSDPGRAVSDRGWTASAPCEVHLCLGWGPAYAMSIWRHTPASS